jgi:hypothetical protein
VPLGTGRELGAGHARSGIRPDAQRLGGAMEIIMHAQRVTPGTVLYAEARRSDGGKARNLYVPKPDFEALGKPQTIRVTVEAVV